MSKYLTNEDAHEVCRLIEEGYRYKEIAEKFNVNYKVITDIKCGRTYNYISKNYNITKIRYKTEKISDETVHEICKLLEDGYTNKEIADKIKVDPSTISKIRCGKIYTYISKHYKIGKSCNERLSDETIHRVCKLLEEGYRNVDISADFDIDNEVISQIRNGWLFSDISRKYNITKRYHRSKIPEDIMHEICKLKQDGMNVKDIAKEVGIGFTSIYRALKIPKFEHIRRQYNL